MNQSLIQLGETLIKSNTGRGSSPALSRISLFCIRLEESVIRRLGINDDDAATVLEEMETYVSRTLTR